MPYPHPVPGPTGRRQGNGGRSVPRSGHGEEGAKRQHVPVPLVETGSPAAPQHHDILRASRRVEAAGKGGPWAPLGCSSGISGTVGGFVCRIKGRREARAPSSPGTQHKLGTNLSRLGCLSCGCACRGRGKGMGHPMNGMVMPCCAVPYQAQQGHTGGGRAGDLVASLPAAHSSPKGISASPSPAPRRKSFEYFRKKALKGGNHRRRGSSSTSMPLSPLLSQGPGPHPLPWGQQHMHVSGIPALAHATRPSPPRPGRYPLAV